MSTSILVAYATRYGSTREVAEFIAVILQGHGFDVDVQSMRDTHALEEYQAIVLGAPFYMGRWPADALRFLSRHHDALMERSVALFALGPLSTDEQEIRDSRDQFDSVVEQHPTLKLDALEMFGGKYDPSKLGFSHRLLVALPASPLHGMSARDLRDWAAIRAWANELADKLQSGAHVQEVELSHEKRH